MSLVELLVAMALGLVVVGAILVNFTSTGASSGRQTALAQMGEDAQLAFSLLSRDLQMAGYTQPTGITNPAAPGAEVNFIKKFTGRPLFACARPMVSASAPLVGGDDGVTCAAAGSTSSHSLVVNYEADASNAVVNAGGNPTDCLGTVASTVAASPTYTLVSDRYYVATSGSTNRPELRCAGPGTAGQALIENVEAMRLWMGQGNAASPRRPVRYVTPDLVTDWGQVVSVRICLLMRSADPVLTAEDVDAANYRDCDGNNATSPDRRIRRAFFSTVALRNKTAF